MGDTASKVLQASYETATAAVDREANKSAELAVENITEYICRAEACQYQLKQVGDVRQKMLVAMVLKGLPREYETFATLVKFSCESKSLDEIKRPDYF